MSVAGKGEGQKAYRVLKIDELVRQADAGGIERYYLYTIRTRSGVTLTVDGSEADFKADKMGPVLAERATEADKIMSL